MGEMCLTRNTVLRLLTSAHLNISVLQMNTRAFVGGIDLDQIAQNVQADFLSMSSAFLLKITKLKSSRLLVDLSNDQISNLPHFNSIFKIQLKRGLTS